MAMRLTPVTLIVGAGASVGAACAHELARRSTGGLLLADADESALAVIADELDAAGAAPERVSTLAFDPADEHRWRQAVDFIEAQYGRIDWIVANTGAAPGEDEAALDKLTIILRAVSPLLRKNMQGGSIVFATSAGALKLRDGAALLDFVRSSSAAAAAGDIRINAIAASGADLPMWASLPWLHELSRTCGGELAAFEHIAQVSPPAARYGANGNVARLIAKLVADDTTVSGVTLVVDGGYAL